MKNMSNPALFQFQCFSFYKVCFLKESYVCLIMLQISQYLPSLNGIPTTIYIPANALNVVSYLRMNSMLKLSFRPAIICIPHASCSCLVWLICTFICHPQAQLNQHLMSKNGNLNISKNMNIQNLNISQEHVHTEP